MYSARPWFSRLAVGVVALVSAAARGSDPGLVAVRPDAGPAISTTNGFMVPYQQVIPGTNLVIEMVPVPAGTLTIGSVTDEKGRSPHEGPQRTLKIAPYWIGRYEVTWDQYRIFMSMYEIFKEFESRQLRLVTETNLADAVTSPTPLYEPEFTFKLGDKDRHPAVTMTQYAAQQFTKWLSGVSDHFYRLPTEVEWEYACRAGSTTRYSFGNDDGQLGEYAWYQGNSGEGYHEVGQKRPNAWGLYDMHGNVAELVLDEFSETAYETLQDGMDAVPDAIRWGNKAFADVMRGGSWDSEPDQLRSASREATEDWRQLDPNFPLSPWWCTDPPARCVGMRIVRPLQTPSANQRAPYWNADSEEIEGAVESRVLGGRGIFGLVDPTLVQAIEELKKNR